MKYRNIILGILISFLIVSCNNEDVDDFLQITEADLIAEGSDLFSLISQVTDDDPNDGEITCIDFIYAFTVVVYSDDIDLEYSEIVSNDQEFSDLLGSIEEGQYVGISFPIRSTLDDGTTFEVNDKDELKEAIDACKEEEQQEIIGTCTNLLLECVWEVQIPDDVIFSTYTDAVFDVNNDGTVAFYYRGDLYEGTWIVYFIEDQLHININLDDDGDVGLDWNFDWKTVIVDNATMNIRVDEDTRFVLKKECEEENYCTTLDFEVCELEENPGVAEYVLQDYEACIIIIAAPQPELDAMGELPDAIEWELTFYTTQEDADTGVNPIAADVPLTTDTQEIYVRITDPLTQEFYTTVITFTAVTCEE